ncbi:hypothetical protein [Nonomuraea sediminis]|uniref:hypothetical protein n=1 Tax=Nonomuraea sediminis TaxID=2835864 RepID=UPI001BDCB8C7|nr:hypothetical protein [Nonomuraea sediminis]
MSTNIADGGASVGIQAEAIHGDVYFQLPPDASPEQRFELGVRCLSSGMPGKAREYIGEAVMNDHVTSRSCFYLLLATLSGRTLEQIPDEDLAVLRSVRGKTAGSPEDPWTAATRLVNRLLEAAQKDGTDAQVIEKELEELGSPQREEILGNLERIMSGSVKDGLWARVFEAARRDRCDRRRLDRVWLFFQPDPAEARVRRPRPISTTTGDRVQAALTGTIALSAICYLCLQSWQRAWPPTALALLLLASGCYVAARYGVPWRFRVERRQAMDRLHLAVRRPSVVLSQRGGFVSKIDRQFEYYFARYVPRNADRADWLAHTAGIRQALRDEVVELYRESRIDAKRVAWLTRYLVSDVKDRWQQGTLWDYRERLRVPAATKALCVLGVCALSTGMAIVTWNGAHVSPAGGPAALIIALATGWAAAGGRLRIVIERDRHAAEQEESDRLLAGRRAALERWRAKLAHKPSDLEMAHWLDCDRKALMEEAMRHYRLAPRDVVGHAFIEAPGTSYKRARLSKGPWRYSRYKLLIFLLTKDGVRQLAVDLDFEQAAFHDRKRVNYRYDAVAAVHVSEADGGERTFELTLVNGHAIEVVFPADTGEAAEDAQDANQATLDTAGLDSTLHVLEGVAAEGKNWITSEPRRGQERLAELADAAGGLFG